MARATAGESDRRAELEANLVAVRRRIGDACRTAGRDPRAVTLVVVTKTHPPSDVRLLAALGVTDVGENRDQEASAKAADTADLPLTWHFLGRLQTNKCRSVARYAHVVHSVDRTGIIDPLGAAACRAERSLTCLLQVSLDGDPARGGALPEHIPALADAVARTEGLGLGGVMAVAPQSGDPAAAFTRLSDVAKCLRAEHPEATMVSAGMSGDLEWAIASGATHVRIGTAVLGVRPPLR